MSAIHYAATVPQAFSDADASFAALKARVASAASEGMSHGDLERLIEADGREILRQLFQGHLELRITSKSPRSSNLARYALQLSRLTRRSRAIARSLWPIFMRRSISRKSTTEHFFPAIDGPPRRVAVGKPRNSLIYGQWTRDAPRQV
jgi:hypothetical protein